MMNYGCTESIYKHFYGPEADFIGYINKFCSSNYFTYSFNQLKEEYYYKRIIDNTRIDPNTVRLFIRPEDLSEHTVREVVNAIEDLSDFVLVRLIEDTYHGIPIILHDGVLRVIAILRKLGMSNDDIKNRLMACMGDKEQYKVVFSYMAGFLAHVKWGNYKGSIHYRYPHGNEPSIFEINTFDHYGRADCSFFVDNTNGRKDTKEISQILDNLLKMVAS